MMAITHSYLTKKQHETSSWKPWTRVDDLIDDQYPNIWLYMVINDG